MPAHQLTGSRIREKRLDMGLRQSSVAQAVGISPSYLNLIEHNRRRIGGKLLSDLARVLDVDASLLTEGADTALLDQMRTAAALGGGTAEVARAAELAARYPGWSALIAAQSRRLEGLEERVQSLTDRMAHDPQLAASLHEVISAVTAIRSSASILVGQEQLDDDWQRRFHENIHNDSRRLAASSEALVAYLDAPDADVVAPKSPPEEVDAFLAKTGFHIAALEKPGANIRPVVTAADLKSPIAAQLLQAHCLVYAADAAAMPMDRFDQACRDCKYDPAALATSFGTSLPAVLRRLATLPPDKGHPPLGLAACDASGALTCLKTVPAFSMPRSGAGCPMWPLFQAFTTPGQPIRVEVASPGPTPTRFLCYAVAEPRAQPVFDQPRVLSTTMLVMPDPPEGPVPPRPVGVSCRICPREACPARREPAMVGVGADD